MQQYLDLLRLVQTTGNYKPSRGVVQSTNSSVGVKSIFGHQMRFNLQQGFPLVTTKTLSVHSIVHELLWFISGDTNIRYLKEHKVRIWDEWADENGDLGPVYGAQWRKWPTPEGGTIDQLGNLIAGIQKNPHGRRHIISAWNVAEIDKMKLPPCHVLSQFYVADGKLSCQLYQRSADLFLGVPFNIASYALLTHLVARVCGLDVGDFIHTFGDAHIYEIHDEQVALQLTREPKKLPTLWLDPSITRIEDFKREHIRFDDYVADPKIAGEVVV